MNPTPPPRALRNGRGASERRAATSALHWHAETSVIYLTYEAWKMALRSSRGPSHQRVWCARRDAIVAQDADSNGEAFGRQRCGGTSQGAGADPAPHRTASGIRQQGGPHRACLLAGTRLSARPGLTLPPARRSPSRARRCLSSSKHDTARSGIRADRREAKRAHSTQT